MSRLENVNPEVFERVKDRDICPEEEDDNVHDEIDSREVFDLIRCINDPEHPLTLEELNVLQQAHIDVNDAESRVTVHFTPTIAWPHSLDFLSRFVYCELFPKDSKLMLGFFQEHMRQSMQ